MDGAGADQWEDTLTTVAMLAAGLTTLDKRLLVSLRSQAQLLECSERLMVNLGAGTLGGDAVAGSVGVVMPPDAGMWCVALEMARI